MHRLVLTAFSFLLFLSLSVGQIHLKGIVTDNTGEPLINAGVQSKKQPLQTFTDVDGTFELEVDSLPVEVIFSYAGFADKKVTVSSISYLEVVLTEPGCDYYRRKSFDLGVVYDLSNENIGVDFSLSLPYLLGFRTGINTRGNLNITNDIRDYDLEVSQSSIFRTGQLWWGVSGGYDLVDLKEGLEKINMYSVGANLFYHGLNINLGYTKSISNTEDQNDPFTIKKDGFNIGISSSIVWNLFAEIDFKTTGSISLYRMGIHYHVPYKPLTLVARYSKLGDYQSIEFGARAWITWY